MEWILVAIVLFVVGLIAVPYVRNSWCRDCRRFSKDLQVQKSTCSEGKYEYDDYLTCRLCRQTSLLRRA